MEEVFMETHAFYLTDRLHSLKERYLKTVPSITIHRAVAFTEIAGKYPNLPSKSAHCKKFSPRVRNGAHANPAGGADRRTSLRKTARRRIFPGYFWDWLEPELVPSLPARGPLLYSEADKR